MSDGVTRLENANRFPGESGDVQVNIREGGYSIYGLARSAVRVSATSYSATEVLGFQILNKGTGTLTLSPVSGVTDIVITAAELTAMGDAAYEEKSLHCDSITAGTGMEVMVYVPS